MNKIDSTISRLGAGILISALLAGCSGGGDGANSAAPTPSVITVSPSLGKFSVNTQVNLKKIDGTLLGIGAVAVEGTSTVTLPAGYTGPIVVEVLGGSGVTYYDEKSNTDIPFASGRKLRACMPSVQAQVGVTALTNAAVARLEAAGTLASATVSDIQRANLKVAAVFGLSDILLAPTPVASTTGTTLDVARLEDKYALVLAALAKTATGTSYSAADVAENLASDLKDDKLDGMDGTSATPASPLPAYNPSALAAQYQNAAVAYADPASLIIVQIQPLEITADVAKIVVVSSNQSDVSLAKAMFADLRTTGLSLSNANNNGFPGSKATSHSADFTAIVATQMDKVASRLGALSNAVNVFVDRNNYSSTDPLGFVSGPGIYDPIASALTQTPVPALARETGSIDAAMKGLGSLSYCWTDPVAATVSTVSCAIAGPGSADFSNPANVELKMLVFAVTGTPGSNAYSYTATRYNLPVTNASGVWDANGYLIATTDPAGTGSWVQDSAAQTTFEFYGTLPPSVAVTAPLTVTGIATAASAVDTIHLSAARTALVAAANSFHYALTGSVSAADPADSSKLQTLSFETGSYFDLDETLVATTGNKMMAAKMIGTVQTDVNNFTGTVDVGSFRTNADGMDYMPTSVVLNGSIRDSITGEVLTGKLEASIANYIAFSTILPLSDDNYRQASLIFTGTVQQPGQSLMNLVLATVHTGFATNSLGINYNFGTQKNISVSLMSDDTSMTSTLTLSNQDGVQVGITTQNYVAAPSTSSGVVTRSGNPVATINTTMGIIHYIDGVTESLM